MRRVDPQQLRVYDAERAIEYAPPFQTIDTLAAQARLDRARCKVAETAGTRKNWDAKVELRRARQNLIQAEHTPNGVLAGPAFQTKYEIHCFITHCTQSTWWRQMLPHCDYEIRFSNSHRPATCSKIGRQLAHIKLTGWARNRTVLIHEMAHGVTYDLHGPKFCFVYLYILEHVHPECAKAMRAEFLKRGIRIATAYEFNSLAFATVAVAAGPTQ